MPTPRFNDEMSMAAWFEESDLDAEAIEVAADVRISPNLRIHIEQLTGGFYTVSGEGVVGDEQLNAAASKTDVRDSELLVA